MNRIIVILSLTIGLIHFSCNNKEEGNKSKIHKDEPVNKSAKDSLTVLTGNFLYFADAAVLKVNEKVYSVEINEKMHELNTQAQAFKNTDTDDVKTTIKATIKPKPEGEEGWPMIVNIVEILKVEKAENQELIESE